MIWQERRRKKRSRRTGGQLILFIALVIIVVIILKACSVNNESGTDALSGDVAEQQAGNKGDTQADGDDLPDVTIDDWELMLINENSPLPDNYVPTLSALENGLNFDSRAIYYLNKMLDAGDAQGLELIVCSAYRSMVLQTKLFNEQVEKQRLDGNLDYETAVTAAKTVVTYPGHSEHNAGLAADIVCESYQNLDEGFADTAAGKWLAANCAQYGFIIRYPDRKTDITGVINESWHFRYVGKKAAEYMTEHDLCLEEFVELLSEQEQ